MNSPTPYFATTADSRQHGVWSPTKPRRWQKAPVGESVATKRAIATGLFMCMAFTAPGRSAVQVNSKTMCALVVVRKMLVWRMISSLRAEHPIVGAQVDPGSETLLLALNPGRKPPLTSE